MEDQQTLLELASEEGDEATLREVEQEIKKLRDRAEELELKRLLSGESDANSVYLSINSGAGGTEAADWASMLLRMYLRYSAEKEYQADVVEVTEGDEAGIKSATVHIQGPYAYGHLKAESGVHRLVRISPFDSNAGRSPQVVMKVPKCLKKWLASWLPLLKRVFEKLTLRWLWSW